MYCVWLCVVLIFVMHNCWCEVCIIYMWRAFSVYRWCSYVTYFVNVWHVCGMFVVYVLCVLYFRCVCSMIGECVVYCGVCLWCI